MSGVALALSLAIVGSAAGAVTIVNPGFEGGFYVTPYGEVGTGWDYWPFVPGGFFFYDESFMVHSGGHAQGLQIAQSNIALWQPASGLSPGQQYVLSVWLFADQPVECVLGYEPSGGPPDAIMNWTPVPPAPGIWVKAEMPLLGEGPIATIALSVFAPLPAPVMTAIDDWEIRQLVPPTCSFTMSPSPAATEQVVTFDSTSTDEDGAIVASQWSFGDGDTASGDPVTHAYAIDGTYTVALTVTDDDGLTATCSDTITVEGIVISKMFPYGWSMMSLPLEPVDPDPEVVFAGIAISGNLHRYDHYGQQYKTYYDFNPSEFGGPLQSGEGYWFNCLSPEGCEVRYAGHERTSSFVLGLPEPGWYLVGASDVDFHFDDILVSDGMETRFFAQAANVWLQDPLIGYDNAGAQYFAAGILPTDDDHYLRTWNGYWVYAFEGNLTTILNKPPVANAGDDRAALRGHLVMFDGTGSYDPDGSIVSYSWDFGDGSGDSGAIATHSYPILSDVYFATLTVTDDMGNTASDGLAVYVEEQIYLLDIHYAYGDLSLNDVTLDTGFVPDRWVQPEAGYRAEVVSDTGHVLYWFRFDIPLYLMYDNPMGETDDELTGGAIALAETDVVLIIPHFDNAVEVRIYDAGDVLRLTVGLTGVTAMSTRQAGASVCKTVKSVGASKYAHDIVFVGDNYSTAELTTLANNVTTHRTRLLGVAPFSTGSGVINVHYVDVASDTGTYALGCYYNCNGMARLICCNNTTVVTTGSKCPADEIIVLVKGNQYGGGGYRGFGGLNSYAMAYAGRDPNFIARNAGEYVTVHEAGHSFGNLHDEYSYAAGTATIPDGANCDGTAGCPKWGGVPGCSAVCSYTNWYKPTSNTCLMQAFTYNPFAFCAVCRNELSRLLNQYWADKAPTVALTAPQDNLKTNSTNIAFTCNVTDDNGLVSVSLYGDFSGAWQLDQMQAVTGTLKTVSFNKTGLADGTYQWNCEATDTVPQSAFAANNYTLTVDTTPPSSVSNLQVASCGDTWIQWSWTNPTETDFDHVEVWIDGTFKQNVTGQSYTATGLTPNTAYEIQTRTVDDVGNVNPTWVTLSAKTCVVPVDDLVITSDTTLCSGTYNITDVSGDGVIIIGADNVTLDCNDAELIGDGTGYGIRSARSGVTIKNADVSTYYYAINLMNATSNLVTDCTVSDSNEGIHMDFSVGNSIKNNDVIDNGNGIFATGAGNGSNTVEGNTITNHTGNAIGLSGAGANNVVKNNTISDADTRGIDLYQGSNTLVEGNTIEFASTGIDIRYFGGTTVVKDNVVTDSTGYGLLTQGLDGVLFEGNTFQRSVSDMMILMSTFNCTFRNNTIASASATHYGIRFHAGEASGNNLFYDNSISNTNNVSDPYTNTWNVTCCPAGPNILGGPWIGGNYWSDYTGADTDVPGDYIGDTNLPYNTGITTGGDYLPLVPWP